MRTFRRPSSLAALVVILTILRIPVSAQNVTDAERIAIVKASFAAQGLGPGADVTVDLRTGKRVKGTLLAARDFDETLVIVNKRTAQPTYIPYQDIVSIERGAFEAKTILIVVGAVASAIAVAILSQAAWGTAVKVIDGK